MTQKTVFAIIVSWNGTDWLPQAIESLRRSTYPAQVVVVDNGSTDGTVALLERSYAEAHVLAMDSNLGFGQANNHGLRYALSHGADYVLLMNQDVKLEPATLEMLVRVSEQHPDFGIISPLHLDYGGAGIDPLLLQKIGNNVDLLSDAFACRLAPLYEVPFINAAVWLLPRRTILTVGGFDPLFFHYGEDVDYCQRVKYHGFRIGLAPRISARHSHGLSSSSTFRSKTSIHCARLLHNLKNPQRSFSRNVLAALRLSVRGLAQSLLHLDARETGTRMCAGLEVAPKLRMAYRHYKRSKEQRPFL